MRTPISVAAAVLVTSAGPCVAQTSRATYEIEMTSHWTLADHGDGYIASAHFSVPPGMIHGDDASMWEPDGLASDAIEAMAERGDARPLFDVADAFVADGTARHRIRGRGIGPVESFTIEWDLTERHHRFTMVSMLAPSPDWFVSVSGLSLLDGNGDWIDELVVPLTVWDAGTDSGATFTAPNDDTQPQEPIRNIHGEPPFAGTPAVATFTFRLLAVVECPADANRDDRLDSADFFAWVQAFGAQSASCDVNQDGVCNGSDFFAWVNAFGIGC